MRLQKKANALIVIIMIATILYALGPNAHSVAAATSGTFGVSSVGGTMIGTGGSAAKTGGYFYLSTSGTVTKITAYIRGSGYAKAAIYSDLNGAPNVPLGGVTQQVSVPSSAGWVDFWYSNPVSLQAGGYWLTLIYDSGCNWFFSSGGVSAWNFVGYSNEPVSPFGSHTDRTDSISIYATYSSGSSSTPTPTPTPAPTSTPTQSVSGTFGVSSVGGTMIGTGGSAAKTGGYFYLSTSGTVTKITAYIRGSGYAKAAIYSDLNGAPNVPLGGVTQQVSVPSSAGWVDFWYSNPVSLQAGGYWLTLIYDSGCNWFFSSGGVSAWNFVGYSNEPVSPFGSHTDRTDSISIYATYSSGSSSTPTPTPTPAPTSTPTQSVSGTFGVSSVGGTMIGTGGSAAKTGGYFYLSTSGTVTKITAYIRGSGYAKAAIYSDLNGAPNVPLGGVTQQVSVPSSAGWVDFWYSNPVSLQAGGYWLTLIYDSGCNWFFSSGGVSAWNFVGYSNEPVSPFGSHTDRTDSISIYATYSSGSSSTPTPTPTPAPTSYTSTINKASVVYATSAITSSDVTYITSHFNMIDTDFGVSAVSSIKAKNPSVKVIGYKDLLAMQTSYSDWAVVNSHEDWFIHDTSGNRIRNSLYGWYLMDVGNAGWRAHWVSDVNSRIGTLYDGVFIDDVWNALGGYVSGVSSSVLSNWHSNVLGMLQYIKANISPGKLVIINTDEWNTYTYVSAVDGEMLEGFTHTSWEACNTQGSRDPGLIMVILKNMAVNSAAGKIVWAHSGALVTSDSAEMARMVKYCYASYLLAASGPGAYWGFNSWTSSDGSKGYYSIMDTQIGSPTNAYYSSQNVYMRDFTGGKALFNPSGNSYTINLGGTYRTLSGSNSNKHNHRRLQRRNTLALVIMKMSNPWKSINLFFFVCLVSFFVFV